MFASHENDVKFICSVKENQRERVKFGLSHNQLWGFFTQITQNNWVWSKIAPSDKTYTNSPKVNKSQFLLNYVPILPLRFEFNNNLKS